MKLGWKEIFGIEIFVWDPRKKNQDLRKKYQDKSIKSKSLQEFFDVKFLGSCLILILDSQYSLLCSLV